MPPIAQQSLGVSNHNHKHKGNPQTGPKLFGTPPLPPLIWELSEYFRIDENHLASDPPPPVGHKSQIIPNVYF